MKAPYTGEVAYPLTQSQVQALSDLSVCDPTPHFVPNKNTAVGLLNRGFIQPTRTGEPMHAKSLYRLTDRGKTAFRICVRKRA